MPLQISEISAGLALVISGCSLAVSLRTHLRDRYRLRFDGFMLVTIGPREESFQIGVTVTNDGRRPISITEVYFETDPAKDEYPIRSPIHGGLSGTVKSVVLAEFQPHQFLAKKMTKKEALRLAKTIDLYVEDSAGKSYIIPIQNEAYSEGGV